MVLAWVVEVVVSLGESDVLAGADDVAAAVADVQDTVVFDAVPDSDYQGRVVFAAAAVLDIGYAYSRLRAPILNMVDHDILGVRVSDRVAVHKANISVDADGVAWQG
jgi:hypothetical protein